MASCLHSDKRLELPTGSSCWTEALENNVAWWEGKADHHIVSVSTDTPQGILEENKQFSQQGWLDLNRLVITVGQQDGTSDVEMINMHPEFIKSHLGRQLPDDFPTEDVRGKSQQRPFIDFLLPRVMATALYSHINKKYGVLVVDTKNVAANKPAFVESKLHDGRIWLNTIDLQTADGKTTTICNVGRHLTPIEDIELYTENLTPEAAGSLVMMTVIDFTYGADGGTLLQELITGVKASSNQSSFATRISK